jgi:hypothetical protein
LWDSVLVGCGPGLLFSQAQQCVIFAGRDLKNLNMVSFSPQSIYQLIRLVDELLA